MSFSRAPCNSLHRTGRQHINLHEISPARRRACQRSDFCLLSFVNCNPRLCKWILSEPDNSFQRPREELKSSDFSFLSAPKSLMHSTHSLVIRPAVPRSQLTQLHMNGARRLRLDVTGLCGNLEVTGSNPRGHYSFWPGHLEG